MGGRGPGAASCTGAGTGAARSCGTHAARGAGAIAGRARRGVHRVLGRRRSRRCRLVGVLETGAARGAKPRAAARHEAVMKALLLAVLMLLAGIPAFAQESVEPATPRSWQSLSPRAAAAPAQLSGQLGQLARRETAGADPRQRSLDPHDAGGALRRAGALQDLACTAARATAAATRTLAPVQGAAPGKAAADSQPVQHLPTNAGRETAGAA